MANSSIQLPRSVAVCEQEKLCTTALKQKTRTHNFRSTTPIYIDPTRAKPEQVSFSIYTCFLHCCPYNQSITQLLHLVTSLPFICSTDSVMKVPVLSRHLEKVSSSMLNWLLGLVDSSMSSYSWPICSS